MVSKVQPELLRQVSVNRLLGANSMALQNSGIAAPTAEVMDIIITIFKYSNSIVGS